MTVRALIIVICKVRSDLDHFLGHFTRTRFKRASAPNSKDLNFLSRLAPCINAYETIATWTIKWACPKRG